MQIFKQEVHPAWLLLSLALAVQTYQMVGWTKEDVIDTVHTCVVSMIIPLIYSINLAVISAIVGAAGSVYLAYTARHAVVRLADRNIPLFGAARQLISWSLSPWRYWAVGLTFLTFISLITCLVYYAYVLIKRGSVKVIGRVPYVYNGEQYLESEIREADDGKVTFVVRKGGAEEAESSWFARNIEWISSTSIFISAVIILQAAALTSSWIRGLNYIASIVPKQRIVTEILEAFRGFSDYVNTSHPTWTSLTQAERDQALQYLIEWARDGKRPAETLHVTMEEIIHTISRITPEEIDQIGQMTHLPGATSEKKQRIAVCVSAARCPKNLAFLKDTKTVWLAAGVIAVFALAVWYLREKSNRPFEASRKYSKKAARAMLAPREDFVVYNRKQQARAGDLVRPATLANTDPDFVGSWADDDGTPIDLPEWPSTEAGAAQQRDMIIVQQDAQKRAAAAAAGDVSPLVIAPSTSRSVITKVSKLDTGSAAALIKSLDVPQAVKKTGSEAAVAKAQAAVSKVSKSYRAGARKLSRESAVPGSIMIQQRTESVVFDTREASQVNGQSRVQVWAWNGYLIAPVTHHLAYEGAPSIVGLARKEGDNFYSGNVKWMIDDKSVLCKTFAYHYKFGIPGKEFVETCLITRIGVEFSKLFSGRGLTFEAISFSGVSDHGDVLLSWHDGKTHSVSHGHRFGVKYGMTVRASSEPGTCGGIYYATDGNKTVPVAFHVFDAARNQQFAARIVDLGLPDRQKELDAFFAKGRARSSSGGTPVPAAAALRH